MTNDQIEAVRRDTLELHHSHERMKDDMRKWREGGSVGDPPHTREDLGRSRRRIAGRIRKYAAKGVDLKIPKPSRHIAHSDVDSAMRRLAELDQERQKVALWLKRNTGTNYATRTRKPISGNAVNGERRLEEWRAREHADDRSAKQRLVYLGQLLQACDREDAGPIVLSLRADLEDLTATARRAVDVMRGRSPASLEEMQMVMDDLENAVVALEKGEANTNPEGWE